MLAPLYLSATQIGKLTDCENRWVLSKLRSSERGPAKSVPLLLGTLMHTLFGDWYLGKPWQLAWLKALEEDDSWEPGFEWPEYFDRAIAIMEDWDRLHPNGPDATVLAIELPFDVPVPGVAGVRVRGFLDGIVAEEVDGNRTHDLLRVLEFKTMGRWGREDLVPDDPQLHLYMWAAAQMFPVVGSRFEAISTYKYKDPEPEKRFKRLILDFDQRKVDMAVENLQKVARRAKQLIAKPELAIKNVSENACRWCDNKVECLRPWELEA